MKSLCLILSLLCFIVPTLPVDADTLMEEQVRKEIDVSTNAIRESYEGTRASTLSSVATWPSGHPTDALRNTFNRFSDQFTAYVWREQGEVWLEAVPVSAGPFVCSSSFLIIQNGVQFNTVKLTNFAGDSQCGDVFVKSVYKISQWSFITHKADLSQAFTLGFNSVSSGLQTLDVPSASVTPPPTPAIPECTVTFNASTATLHIPCFRFENATYWMDLGVHSGSPLLLDIKGFGVK